MSAESFKDDALAVPVSKAELAADAAETRALVAADIEALKSQLTVDRLKDRALDAAERSVESVALRAVRRLTLIPVALRAFGREHPRAAAGAVFALVGLALLRARARSRRPRSLFA